MDSHEKAPTEEPPTQLIQFLEDIKQSADDDKLERGHTSKMDKSDMENVGQMLEHCIQQVSLLEIRRDELIQELLYLQEPMMQIVDQLREKLREKRRLIALAQMDHTDVFEEVQQVKRKLFNTARDCIHSQVMLAEQEYWVAQAALTKVRHQLGAFRLTGLGCMLFFSIFRSVCHAMNIDHDLISLSNCG